MLCQVCHNVLTPLQALQYEGLACSEDHYKLAQPFSIKQFCQALIESAIQSKERRRGLRG